MKRGIFILASAVLVSIFIGDTAVAQEKAAKTFSGVASYYDKNYQGRTARGDKYDGSKFTAAHRTLPFGTRVRVTGPGKRSVVVEINDRGPFIKSRVIDLSYAAAQELRIISRGLARVTVEILSAGATTVSDNSAQ